MTRIIRKSGSKKLYLDYKYNGKRIQRTTGLNDTPDNRATLENELIPKLEAQIMLELLNAQNKTFKHYADLFLESKAKNKSYDQKKYVFDKVIEYFGNIKVQSITRANIKKYLRTLNIKDDSKRPYLGAIKGILDEALDDESVDRNVAIGIKLESSKPEPMPFSQDEVIRVLNKADGMLKNFLAVGFYTGMRSGEILGLMHSDIGDDTISIKRSISKGKITKPKTEGSIRTIPMFDAVRPYLEDQRKRSKGLYLFDISGHPISDVTVFGKRKWRKLLEECRIEYRKIYSTRHTFVTAMLNSRKYPITTIAKILGHSNIKMIVQNYSGYIEDQHLMVNYADDIFRQNRKNETTKRLIL